MTNRENPRFQTVFGTTGEFCLSKYVMKKALLDSFSTTKICNSNVRVIMLEKKEMPKCHPKVIYSGLVHETSLPGLVLPSSTLPEESWSIMCFDALKA